MCSPRIFPSCLPAPRAVPVGASAWWKPWCQHETRPSQAMPSHSREVYRVVTENTVLLPLCPFLYSCPLFRDPLLQQADLHICRSCVCSRIEVTSTSLASQLPKIKTNPSLQWDIVTPPVCPEQAAYVPNLFAVKRHMATFKHLTGACLQFHRVSPWPSWQGAWRQAGPVLER